MMRIAEVIELPGGFGIRLLEMGRWYETPDLYNTREAALAKARRLGVVLDPIVGEGSSSGGDE